MPEAYIGLGSNRSHAGRSPQALLQAGLEALRAEAEIRLLASSRLYASAPLGPQDQPDYVNAVAHIDTTLAPEALLDCLQSIEAALGRDRASERRWGERSLDLDILLYGNQQIQTPRLTVPHAQLSQRAFVLYPLAELAPDLQLPAGSITALIAALEQTQPPQRLSPLADESA